MVRSSVMLAAVVLAGCAAPIHLVIDAGSSGTRYCAFPVERASSSGCAVAAPASANPCYDVAARDGLADLPPAEVEAVLAAGLDKLPSDARANLRSIALLGTGGFRRHPQAEQQARIDRIARWFDHAGLPALAQVIDGDEEGRLAWRAIRELTGSQRHTIIETGGSTVQLASGAGDAVHALSAPVGMNEARRTLRTDPAFAACQNASGAADRCIGLVRERIFAGSSVARPGFPIDPVAYAMGAPWIAIFDGYLRRERTDIAGLRTAAGEICKLSAAEIIAAGYEKSPSFAASGCYLMSYHVAQIEATGAIREIRRGGESWPRGAAVDARYFPGCAIRP